MVLSKLNVRSVFSEARVIGSSRVLNCWTKKKALIFHSEVAATVISLNIWKLPVQDSDLS